MDIEKLEKILTENNQPKFRLEQIKKAIYRDGISSFSEITNLPKSLRETLEEKIEILPFSVGKILVSRDKKSAKALFRLADGKLLESVLISPMEKIWSACVSSQVGCALGCRFCATGKMGFSRNLTAEEIEGQVLFWKQYLRTENQQLSTIVYMGMGEPFLNWDEVKNSLKDLIDKDMFGLSSRSISVSTSGIVAGIEELAREFPQVNLAVSLHAATDGKRDALMPINRKNDLESLEKSLGKYFSLTNRKVFLEYIMLEGINDTASDAEAVSEFIRKVGKKKLLHVNLISYNTTGPDFKPSSRKNVSRFKRYLENLGISATIRKSLGEEIFGACGQLAGK